MLSGRTYYGGMAFGDVRRLQFDLETTTQRIKSQTDADVLCPAHPDTRPSLGIDLRRNGEGPEVKIHCRSRECSKDDRSFRFEPPRRQVRHRA